MRPSQAAAFMRQLEYDILPKSLPQTSSGELVHCPDKPVANSSDAKEPPRKSRLLALPAELRNRIYEYALTTDVSIWYPRRSDPGKTKVQAWNAGLLLVSKQVHHETKGLYYPCTTFICDDEVELYEWWRMLRRPLRYKIQHVKVVLWMYGVTQADVKDVEVEVKHHLSSLIRLGMSVEIEALEGKDGDCYEDVMKWMW